MANPQRPDQRDSPARKPAKSSNRGLYIGIAVVVVLLILLFFGGFFTDDTIIEEDAAVETTTPDAGPDPNTTATEGTAGEDTEVITSDPEPTAPDIQPDATDSETVPRTAPETETDTSAPADPGTDTQSEEVIEIEGDADVEVLDES